MKYVQQLRYYAEHYPKASAALLVAGTAASCAAIVAVIELRDRYGSMSHATKIADGKDARTPQVTPREAQLAAMLEVAKNSTWQDNLRNAADAQERFMLPDRDVDAGKAQPEYVKRIDERSDEILREGKEKQEREIKARNDPSITRFWR
ncbi:hypothetical protein ACHAWF_002546 [Thalassiosira exigua]